MNPRSNTEARKIITDARFTYASAAGAHSRRGYDRKAEKRSWKKEING